MSNTKEKDSGRGQSKRRKSSIQGKANINIST